MVDREAAERDTKRLATRLKFAALRQNAVVEDVDLRTPRGIDRALFAKLVAGDWIERARRAARSPGRPASARAGSPARSATRPAATETFVLYHRVAAPVRGARARPRRRPLRPPAQSPRARPTAHPRRLGPARSSPSRNGATSSRSSRTAISAPRPSSPARSPSSNGTRSSATPPSPTPSSTASSTTLTASDSQEKACENSQPKAASLTARPRPESMSPSATRLALTIAWNARS